MGPAANGGGKPVGKGVNMPDQLALLVQSETGYQNLTKLISKAFMEGIRPRRPRSPCRISKASPTG